MDVDLYEVAVLTPYNTGTCFPLLGVLGDHECCSLQNAQQDCVPSRHLQDPIPAESIRGLLGNSRLEKWLELPSYISSADCSTVNTISSVSSLTLSSDPCMSDISWGNKELCSTKYDLEDVDGLNFIPVADSDHQLHELSRSMSAAFNPMNGESNDNQVQGSSKYATTSEIENLLAKIASDMNELRAKPERNFTNSKSQFQPLVNPGSALSHEMCKNPPPPTSLPVDPNGFKTLSNQSVDDIFTTAESHFDHDDDSSSAFSSCRVSRASSQCDLRELGKNPPDNQSFEKSSVGNENTFSRAKRPLPTIKNITPMPTVFTPPQGKKLTSLSIDLESCKGYETCASSGYCDSPTASSVFSDFSEFSGLNPLSRPFVPKSLAGEVAFEETSSLTDKRSNILQIDSLIADSGVEQTNLIGEGFCSILHSVTDIVDSQDRFLEPRFDATEQIPPYLCSVPHGREFTPIKDFSLFSLPEKCRSLKNLEVIKSVSQRVVKLQVSKSFSLLPDGTSKPAFPSSSVFNVFDPDTPVFEHYGTGFACDVGFDRVTIVTHCKVVGSAEEAARTQVWFTLNTDDGNVVVFNCVGQKDGFSLKTNSKSAMFTCKAPPELHNYRNAFQEVPTLNRTSFFANDSCYYSDLSSDSMSDHEEVSADPLRACKEHTSSSTKHSPSNRNLSYADVVNCIPSKSVGGHSEKTCGVRVNPSQGWDKERDWMEEPKTVLSSASEFGDSARGFQTSLSVFDPQVQQAFESVAPGLGDECARPVYEVATPLVLSERRLDAGKMNGCPYASEETFGENATYSYFSSYAGEVLLPFPVSDGAKQWSTPWSYEYLIYSQNHRKDSYKIARAITTVQEHSQSAISDHIFNAVESLGNNVGSLEQTQNSQLFTTEVQTCAFLLKSQELISVEEYLKSWDKDLLNLDENLNCLPPYDPATSMLECRVRQVEYSDEAVNSDQYFEDMVNSIVADDPDSASDKTTRTCCQKSFFSAHRQTSHSVGRGGARGTATYAVIIAHIHGGPKVVSVGQFSRHHHIGGDLYDTPTCMGSCGAPVLALSETCEGPNVTPLVHAGITRVNGIRTGVGFT